jgi:beta-phosphoglucomutase-like phosphatase (HAD superfamily)
VLLVPVSDRSLPGVIFDVDGVLVASPHERAWRESLDGLMRGDWRALAPHASYRPGAFTTEVYQSRVAGKPRHSGAIAVLEYFGVPDAASRASEYAAAKQRQVEALIAAGNFAAFDDALALVIALLAAGNPLAAASSSKNASELIRRIDVARFAERAGLDAAALGGRRTLLDVFAVDVCGAEVGRGKPDPAIFLLAATELGIPAARCIVVEDAPSGIEAAKAGGMCAVGIARWHDEALLLAAGADVVVNRLDAHVLTSCLADVGKAAGSNG